MQIEKATISHTSANILFEVILGGENYVCLPHFFSEERWKRKLTLFFPVLYVASFWVGDCKINTALHASCVSAFFLPFWALTFCVQCGSEVHSDNADSAKCFSHLETIKILACVFIAEKYFFLGGGIVHPKFCGASFQFLWPDFSPFQNFMIYFNVLLRHAKTQSTAFTQHIETLFLEEKGKRDLGLRKFAKFLNFYPPIFPEVHSFSTSPRATVAYQVATKCLDVDLNL